MNFIKSAFNILALLLGATLTLTGQAFPIETNIAISPPYPTNLDAYVDYLEQGIIEINNTGNDNLEVYFDVILEETNGKLSVETKGILGTPIEIVPGLNFLSPNDIQDIFSGLGEGDFNTAGLSQAEREAILLNRQMPEGSYRICIKAFNESGGPLSDPADDGCTFFDIYFAERPIITSPWNGDIVDTADFLLFTWDHVVNSPEALDRLDYTLKIIDLTEQEITNVQRAMLDPGISPDYEEELGNIFSINLQNDIDLPLILGHQYAARITAIDPENRLGFQDGGHSEIITFYYGADEVPVYTYVEDPYITSPKKGEIVPATSTVTISWQQELPFLTNDVKDQLPYTLKLLNTTGKSPSQVQSLFTNTATEFLYNKQDLTGSSVNIKLSSSVPFKVGDTYSVEVALDNMDEYPPNHIPTGNNKSKIITFTYGDIGQDFVPELDTTLANHIQGQVFWAWRSSEDTVESSGESMVVSNPSDLSAESVTYADNTSGIGVEKYPLENAVVLIFGNFEILPWWSIPVIIGAGAANEDGRYQIQINDSYLHLMSNATMHVSQGGNFESYSSAIEIEQTDFGFIMEPVTIAANNCQIAVQVLKEDEADEEVTVRLLLQKDNFEAYPELAQITPNGISEEVEYNNDIYIVTHECEDGNLSKKLFQNSQNFENYVLEVKAATKPAVYYPMSSIYYEATTNKKKVTPLIRKNVIYNIGTTIAGTVYFGADPQRDARVEIKFTDADVSGNYDATQTYIRVTDEDGKYFFNDLPSFNEGTDIDIKVVDRTIREAAFREVITITKESPITKDIYLKNNIYTAYGRLIDQYGLPVANAQIQLDSTQTVYSSDDGFYMVKLHDPLPFYLSIIADGYEDSYILPAYAQWFGGGMFGTISNLAENLQGEAKAEAWKKDIESNSTIQNYLTDKNKSEITADDFNIGFGSLTDRYTTYIESTESLKGNLALNETGMNSKKGIATIHASYDGQLVNAAISFTGDGYSKEDLLQTGEAYKYSAPDGNYQFSITPVTGGPTFVQYFGEIEMDGNYSEELYITLREGTTLSGTVKDKDTNTPLAEATVKVEGMDYITSTNDQGQYTLYIPVNEEFNYIGRKTKYNRADTTMIIGQDPLTYDFLLEPRDASLPDFEKLSQYPVEIDFVEDDGSGGYTISGRLTLKGNDLFTPDPNSKTLEFKDVSVSEDGDDQTNAIPAADFAFEQAELNVKAYGYAPVLATGSSRVQMKKLQSTDSTISSKATIGATKLILQLDSDQSFGSFPFEFPNAMLTNKKRSDYAVNELAKLGFDLSGDSPEEIAEKKKTATGQANFLFEELNYERMFISPGSKVAEISKFTEFRVDYVGNDFEHNFNITGGADNSNKYKNFVVSDLLLSKMLINKDESSMDQYGVHMDGFLELPAFIGMRMKIPNNRVEITKLSLGQNFTVNELAFKVRPNNPLKASIKTWEATFTELKLYGLGTTNLGLGFGGSIRVKQDTGTPPSAPEPEWTDNPLYDGDDEDEPNWNNNPLYQGNQNNNANAGGNDPEGPAYGPEAPPHLTINTFKVVNHEGPGITVNADLSISPIGIKVGPLKVSQGYKKSIWMNLDTKDYAFTIKASDLKLQAVTDNKLANKIFPMDILQFNFKSSDWSVLMAMKPNIKANFGPVTVNLDKFLINYGYQMSMDKMNELMKMTDEEKDAFFGRGEQGPGLSPQDVAYFEGVIAAKERAGLPVPQHIRDILQDHESKGSIGGIGSNDLKGGSLGGDRLVPTDNIGWAVGISGGVEFPVKGMKSQIHASVLLARNNDKIDFRINEMLLHLKQQAFELRVAAALSVSGNKVGFEAEGELETLKKKFGAGFKFYKYANSSAIELGAKLIVSTKIVTGPVLWHKIGGGFDFNTYNHKYKVFVTGSAGPIGVPQNVTSVDDAKVSILFDIKRCSYQPIVEGHANFLVKGEQFGRIDAKLDFCRMSAYLDINTTQDLAAGLVKATIGGTVYVLKDGNQGRMYLGLNAAMKDRLGIFNAYGLLGIGVNFKKDRYTPQSLVTTWNKLPSIAKRGGRFHGLALMLDMKIPKKNGKFGISIGSFDLASFQYHAYASAYAHVYKSFDKSTFEVVGKLEVDAGGKLRFLGKTMIGGSVSAKLNLRGGYDYSWHFAASGSLRLEVYNKQSMRCNDWELGTFRSCSDIWYPCGPWYCAGLCEWCCCKRVCVSLPNIIPDFKKCFQASFSFSKRQGKSTYVSFSKK